ncbi:MAG: ABC transporter substrate-binding protein [Synergistaceae bacterium]|jgi:NitT/TauT family transport system substrate-binding protein|nr:ABC transporter substrate-binding protein [Synergistaceae bacterium]
MKRKIREFAMFTFVALLAMFLNTAVSFAAPVKKLLDRPVRLGHYASSCESYFFAAEMLGLYEKYGIDIEFIRVDNTNGRESLASGKIDVSDGVLQSWLKPMEQGFDVKFTLGLHQGCMSAVVRADSPYKTFEDLKGKTIGIAGTLGGGQQNYLFRTILHSGSGLDPRKDFEWLALDIGAAALALDADRVQALAGGDATLYPGIESGKHRYLSVMATDDYNKDELCCLLAFNPTFIKEHPDVAHALTEILYEASEYTNTHKEEVVRYEHGKGYINGTLEANITVIAPYRFEPSVAVGLESFKRSFLDYQELSIIDKGVDMQKIIDRSFVIYDDIDKPK